MIFKEIVDHHVVDTAMKKEDNPNPLQCDLMAMSTPRRRHMAGISVWNGKMAQPPGFHLRTSRMQTRSNWLSMQSPTRFLKNQLSSGGFRIF